MAGTEPRLDSLALLDENQVRDYLAENPDFFQRHPELLNKLHIPHASGEAVSLVEKQVSVLRERNVDLRHRLGELNETARENDQLFARTRSLVLGLLESETAAALSDTLLTRLTDEFDVDHASLVLFGDGYGEGARQTSPEDAEAELGSLSRSTKPVCGILRESEFRYLFPAAKNTGSAAIVPVQRGEELLGLLAVGSADPNRYHNTMGTLFLSHLADVIARLLPRLD
jgi:uncharacterized protein YigA (DUF484 family)